MKRPIISRADLVRMMSAGEERLVESVARQLALEEIEPQETKRRLPDKQELELAGAELARQLANAQRRPDNTESTQANVQQWCVTEYRQLSPKSLGEIQAELESHSQNLTSVAWRPEQTVKTQLDKQYVSRIGAVFDGCFRLKTDLPKLIDWVANQRNIVRLPQVALAAERKTTVIVDRSERLIPYDADHDFLANAFNKSIPPYSFEKRYCLSPDGMSGGESYHPQAVQIVVLGDLGVLSGWDRLIDHWLDWGKSARFRGCSLVAVVPFGKSQVSPRISRKLRKVFELVHWNQPVNDLGTSERAAKIREIVTLASPVFRLEPGLLRELRKLVVDGDDLTLESDIWDSEYIQSPSSVAATLDPEVRSGLLSEFEMMDRELRRAALGRIREWRLGRGLREVWYAELLSLGDDSRSLVPADDLERARNYFREKYLDFKNKKSENSAAAKSVLYRFTARLSRKAFDDPEVGEILRNSELQVRGRTDTAKGDESCTISLPLVEGELSARVADSPDKVLRQHEVYRLNSSSSYLNLGEADQFWKISKPNFVDRYGTDEYGLWLEFDIENEDESQTATQRMRWIQPGKFLMGSPDDDEEAYGDEKPQTEVELTKGFWLADSPCTQQLWKVLTTETPSHFKGANRPVEQVSWDDSNKFLNKLGEHLGVEFRLPNEAQWEYACRAGTSSRYHYGVNIEKSLANYENSETTDVKSYPANVWGLFDMHGNVFEWCSNPWTNDYQDLEKSDPTWETATSGDRVVRGGSWLNDARHVRSAFRNFYEPSNRSLNIGFRCLVQSESAEPSEAAARQAERRRYAAQIGDAEKFESEEESYGNSRSIKIGEKYPTPIATQHQIIQLATDREAITLENLERPTWASAFGRDQYGVYAELDIELEGVLFRWIPPGRFMMGSPEDEPGRFDGETQHEVVISRGFWMMETPVTQRMWLAFEKENPSFFPDPDRPAEQVSHEDALSFLEKMKAGMKGKLGGHELRLPTEAQWEYACRAGTSTAVYDGDFEILGVNNAPALDAIAWYGGNCGQNYDLEEHYDISSWEDKQFDDSKGGTRKVKQKAPNRFGLYDMLGNVWEWCVDWYDNYEMENTLDPVGPKAGSDRVVRGGSWYTSARYVRSAYRDYYEPSIRLLNIGFRCLIKLPSERD